MTTSAARLAAIREGLDEIDGRNRQVPGHHRARFELFRDGVSGGRVREARVAEVIAYAQLDAAEADCLRHCLRLGGVEVVP
jgi:hypothetical protein